MSLPLDLACVLDEFNVGPLSVTRRGAPVRNEFGGYDPDGPTVVPLDPVATYPARARNLGQRPEGDRTAEARVFVCSQRLYVGDAGQAPDVVTYNGRNYRVIEVEEHDTNGSIYIVTAALVHPNGQP